MEKPGEVVIVGVDGITNRGPSLLVSTGKGCLVTSLQLKVEAFAEHVDAEVDEDWGGGGGHRAVNCLNWRRRWKVCVQFDETGAGGAGGDLKDGGRGQTEAGGRGMGGYVGW